MHSLFIIAATVRDWFNDQALALGNNGPAVGTLSLSASGTAPATHGWCAVSLSAEQEAAVTALLAANPAKSKRINWTRYDLNQDPSWPQKQLVALNLKSILSGFPNP
jgi:hypothetical protein